MSDILQYSPSTETEGATAADVPHRAFQRARFTIAATLRCINPLHIAARVSASLTGAERATAELSATERRLRSDIRLITVLSLLLAVSETGRALVLLQKQASRYERHRMSLVEAAGHSLARSVGKLKQLVVSAMPRAPSRGHTATPGIPGNAALGAEGEAEEESNFNFESTDSSEEALGEPPLPQSATETAGSPDGSAGEQPGHQSAMRGPLLRPARDDEAQEVVEEEEMEEEDDGLDSGEDKDIRTKTPLQLIHYWKQMEKAILTTGNRQPFLLPLPERTDTDYDPQLKKRQRPLIHRPKVVVCRETGVAAAVEDDEKGDGAWEGEARRPARRGEEGGTLVLPIKGCFLYERRPDVFDFAWRDVDEEEQRRIKQQEEAEARAHRHPTPLTAAAAAAPRRHALLPSASSRGLVRFDTAAFSPSSPLRGLSQRASSGRSFEETAAAAPPAAAGAASSKERGKTPSSSHHPAWRPPLKWEALFLVWGLSVDYSITIREVRQLLLNASPPAFLAPAVTRGDGPTLFDVGSANLSLLWFLANVRLIYSAIIIQGDIQKCADEMEELDTYMSVIYKKCIARWPALEDTPTVWETARKRQNVWLVCAVQGTWQVLSAAYDELKAARFQQSFSGVWQLAKYMYASSKTKYVSAVLIAALTALNSRVTSAGRLLREEINTALLRATEEEQPDGGAAATGERAGSSGSKPMGLGLLCCYELGRLVLNYVLVRTTSEFIALTAGLRKDTVRAELYEALAHMPLSYFDVRTFDEVESVIYTVDDLEGIDVQINQYIFGAVNTLWLLREALSDVHSGRVLVVAVTTASLPHLVDYAGKRVKAWYDDLLRAGALPWLLNPATSRIAVEEEVFNTDGVLLRGSEIIGAVHQLRPYGADTRLTHWWNQCTQYDPSHPSLVTSHNSNRSSVVNTGTHGAAATAREGPAPAGAALAVAPGDRAGGSAAGQRATRLAVRLAADAKESGYFLLDAVRQLSQMPYGKIVPGIGKGVLDLTDWLLPVFLNALGARWCGLSPSETFRLLDCASAMESGVNVVVEGIDVVRMLLENGYKAAMLERVLDTTCWEATSTEESLYLRNYVNAHEGAVPSTATANTTVHSSRDMSTGDPLASPFSVTPASASPPPQPHVQHPPSAARVGDAVHINPREARLYRHYLLSKIHLRNVQFRYPSAPTTNVIAQKNFSVTLHLLAESDALHRSATYSTTARSSPPPARRGRLVCLTGRSGSGKSTLLHLILALYMVPAGDAPGAAGIELELVRRGRGVHGQQRRYLPRPATDGGHDGTWPSSLIASRTGSCASLAATGMLTLSGPGDESPFSSMQGPAVPSPPAAALPRQTHGGASFHHSLPPRLIADISQVPVDVLRGRLFSYVPQTPTIFSGATIAQNISLAGFVSIATDDILQKVEHCAALACCGPFVKQLPAGLLTRICDSSSGWCNPTGADGRSIVRLTPDQLQRIMIARALYHGGQILLMDEPTANLEAHTAAALRQLWLSLLGDGTVKGIICATHDAELLAAADQVVTLPS